MNTKKILLLILGFFSLAVFAHAQTILPYNRGGTGTTSTPLSGYLFIGNGAGWDLNYLTAGSNVTITTSSGAITIAAGSGAVSTSSAVSVNNYPFWVTVGGQLSGTSTLTISGTQLLQGGAFNASGTITQNGTGVVLTSRLINTTSPITGGGDLSADRTLACATCVINTRAINTGQGLQGGGDLSADRTLSIDTSTALTWSALHIWTGGATFNSTTTNNSSTIFNGAFNFANATGSSLNVTGTLQFNGTAVSTSTGANPSASVGLTVVNGTANTFLRSDGAPALSVSITPVWTALHEFSGAGVSSTQIRSPSSTITGINFTNATGTSLAINSEAFTDFTGTSLVNTAGVLTLGLNANSNQTCSGTNKVSALSATGTITCTADETGAGGSESGWRYNLPFVYLATSTSLVGIGATSTDVALYIQSQSVGTTSLQIAALASQTANLLTISSTTTNFFTVSPTGTVAIRGDNVSTSTGANPSASVALTAVNGTANTFMRSDAAPALSVSIAPTWTGIHIFNNTSTFNAQINFASGTASRILQTDSAKNLQSVANLASWIAGTTSELTVTDDGDGSVTLSLPTIVDLGASSELRVVSSTHSTQLTVPLNQTLTTNGQISISNTSATLNFYASSTQWALQPEQCDIDFVLEAPSSTSQVQEDDYLHTFKATSTITFLSSVHKTSGDTATFNIIWGATSTRASASSTSNHLFSGAGQGGNVTSTSSNAPDLFPNLVSFASTTVNSGSVMRLITSVVSSTQWGITICHRVNP